MHKILVIEDDDRIAGLLKRGLTENDYNVFVEPDGAKGKKTALENDFDLIIIDIILPFINGIDLCKSIKSFKPDIPVIMLTALGTTDDKVEGFDAGADDYLVKPFEMRELLARIRALIKRYKTVSGKSSHFLKYEGLEMNIHTKIVKRDGIEIQLTPKEYKLLEFLMQNNERVISRNEIAENVWDTHFDTGTNFIDVYINYLRNKIDRNFEIKLIHTRTGMGFILTKEK